MTCSKPCTECDECQGYRLKWNRWIIFVERGNRKKLVVEQLPWRTSAAGGGGVPLNGEDCDLHCVKHLGKGAVCFTDGADPYEAFGAGDIACSPTCERQDCSKRAGEWHGQVLRLATTQWQGSIRTILQEVESSTRRRLPQQAGMGPSEECPSAVSYTHLTLPTKRIV